MNLLTRALLPCSFFQYLSTKLSATLSTFFHGITKSFIVKLFISYTTRNKTQIHKEANNHWKNDFS